MALAGTHETVVSPGLFAYAKNSGTLADSAYRLNSGTRIVRSGDDSASISAAASLLSQSATLRSTLVNGARAISFLQVAHDGLNQIREVLDSLSTLTETANRSGITPHQLALLDAQFHSQLGQIDSIVGTATFEGATLLDGSLSGGSAPRIPLGDANGDTITLDIPDMRVNALFTSTPSLATAANAAAAATPVSNAGQTVDDATAKVDAYLKRLDSAAATTGARLYGNGTATENLLATDVPAETQARDFLRIQQQTAASILAQTMGLDSGLLGLLGQGRMNPSGKIATTTVGKTTLSSPAATV